MTSVQIQTKVLSTLQNVLGSTVELSQPLLSSGIIDSISLLDVIMGLEESFTISLEPIEISPETFDTAEKMAVMIQSKLT